MSHDFTNKHLWLDGRYDILPKIINKFGLTTGVEVGVARAGHSDAILRNTQVRRLFGVDPYQHRADYADPMNLPQDEFDALHNFVVDLMKKDHGDRFTLIRKPSLDAAFDFAPGLTSEVLDFVYIDGEHTTGEALIDCAVWYHVLRDGGILAGDDYLMPEVAMAVNYFANRKKKTLNIEMKNTWWFQK
jgi:hypothetical protein